MKKAEKINQAKFKTLAKNEMSKITGGSYWCVGGGRSRIRFVDKHGDATGYGPYIASDGMHEGAAA